MSRKKDRYRYDEGGILEIFSGPRPVRPLGEMTSDKVIRDLKRNEAEPAPRMEIPGAGTATLGVGNPGGIVGFRAGGVPGFLVRGAAGRLRGAPPVITRGANRVRQPLIKRALSAVATASGLCPTGSEDRLASGGIVGLQAGGWGGGGGGWGAGGGGGSGFMANTPQGPTFGQGPDFGSPGSQPWGGGGGLGGGGGGGGQGFMGGGAGGGNGQSPFGAGGGGWGPSPTGGAPDPSGGGTGQPSGIAPVGSFQPYQPQGMPAGYGAPQQYAGYGGPTSMDVRQEFVSPEVARQYADLTQGIMQTGTRPYEQYQGPQLAGFTGMEAAAHAGYGAYGRGAGPQATRQAEATLGEAAGGFGQIAAGARDPELEREADLSKYMSQYTSGVVDPQLRKLQEFQQQQAQELGSQAAGAGAFGGYRQALQQGQQAQAASQQAADIIGSGQQQAFQSAQQAFERDRAAKQAATGQQMTAYGQLAGIGGRQATLGGQQQQQQMNRLQQMQRAGASQRQLQQAALDIQRQQWQQQRQHPERQISWMSGMLGALPYQNIVQSGAYAPQAGPVSRALGSGIAGAGLWSAWQGRQPRAEDQWAQGRRAIEDQRRSALPSGDSMFTGGPPGGWFPPPAAPPVSESSRPPPIDTRPEYV